MGPRTFLTVWEFTWYNCSAVYGSSAWQLYGGTNGNLLQKGSCHTPRVPGLLQPETLSLQQATADPCLCRRHSNTQRQVWLSLCGVSVYWCIQGFIWALWATLVGMGFDSKSKFSTPTVLWGLLLCPWTWGISFWWDATFSYWWLFRMISVHFQGKPFNITVIPVYDPTTNTREAEQFYDDQQDFL